MLKYFGRIATARPQRILGISAGLVIIAIVLGTFSFGKLQGGGFDDPRADSVLATHQIDTKFGGAPDLVFLVTAKVGNVNTTAVDAAGRSLTQHLSADNRVTNVQSYWAAGGSAFVSKDAKSSLVTAHVRNNSGDENSYAAALIKAYGGDNAVYSIKAGGALAINRDITGEVTKDLARAEGIAIPLTMVLLVVAFGAVVAALLPLVIGFVAIFGAFAALFVIGSLTDVSIYALNLTTALGLGLGVDYALLMVNRFREELEITDVNEAVRRTVATAGRTIVFSAGTVALALMALLVFPPFFLRSFAYAGIAVVLIAMFAAIIILPASLALLGERVNKWKLPAVSLRGGNSTFWYWLAREVVRRPIAAALPVLIGLGILAVPVLHISFASPDDRVIPSTFESRQVGNALRNDFSVDSSATMYAVVTGSANESQIDSYARSVSAVPEVDHVVASTGTYVRGALAVPPSRQNVHYRVRGASYLDIVSSAYFVSTGGQNAVVQIRSLHPPSGSIVRLGGPAPTLVDEKRAISNYLPLAIGWIIGTTLILLFVFTGSVVLPVKAVVLNGITLTAVMGAMTWIFEDGHFSSWLNFTARPLDTSMPVLLFCVAFGLSMDYEVFLLSRVKESHDAGASDTEAVVTGLARTGRIVSTAAGLLAVTFVAFGTSEVVFIKMFGIGTAMAILVDATLVRGVLVPAFMQLAGPANWWAPKAR